MLKKIHTYKIGEINRCQVCGNKKLFKFLDLGYQPLADDLLSIQSQRKELIYYPLAISLCEKCSLLQNNYIVGDKKLYPKNYHYVPGITKDVVKSFESMSGFIIKKYNLGVKDLIVDIGCNDGSLLNEFKKKKFTNLLGIEPTDTVKLAKKKKIRIIQDFFNTDSALLAKKKYGNAKIITTTNVFAHTNNLYTFITAAKKLILKDGVFIIENHYLLDVMKKYQFDTFYHEHLRTYSLKSLIKLLGYYGFSILDAYTSDRYGGNIQAHFTLKKVRMSNNVKKILQLEKKSNLNNRNIYINFKNKIESNRDKLQKFLIKNKKKIIVAKAFPARASILMHYFSFLKDYVQYIAEQKTSLKLNNFAPGTNIKIISSEIMKKKKPDIVIVLAWHLFDAIYNKWKKVLGKKVTFVKPLPSLKIK